MTASLASRARILVVATGLILMAWPVLPAAQANVGCDNVLSGNVTFQAGFTVPVRQTWCFDASNSTTVSSAANAIVLGTLRMRPSAATVTHTLRFTGAVESEFIGGGMQPLPTDDGLWVTGEGRLDISGTPKTAWCRCSNDPTWLPGDELRVAPTALNDFSSFAPFTPGTSLPTVAGRSAEVLNLTRNVNIEGQRPLYEMPRPGQINNPGRAHIFIHSSVPQTIRYAAIRYMGPRRYNPVTRISDVVLGRYGLHFHHMGDGSRGSVVEGVIVRDTGGHAFVPHASHGVTFRDTIAYNTIQDAYWWDLCPGEGWCAEGTSDTLIERGMAALIRGDGAAYTLAAFTLGEGHGNVIRNSVATGVQGGTNASGYKWPSSANGADANVWGFENNVGHNNRHHAIFVWQNDPNPHVISNFDSYRNGEALTDHGAYVNSYIYQNVTSYQDANSVCHLCPRAVFQIHGVSNGRGLEGRLIYRKVAIDGAGVSGYAVSFGNHSIGPANAGLLHSFTVTGVTLDAVRIDEGPTAKRGAYDLECWTVNGRELEPTDFTVARIHPGSIYRVQRRDGSAFQITAAGSSAIPAFGSC